MPRPCSRPFPRRGKPDLMRCSACSCRISTREFGRLTVHTPDRATLIAAGATAELVDKMTEARLLVSADGTVLGVAHEALLRRWQRATKSPGTSAGGDPSAAADRAQFPNMERDAAGSRPLAARHDPRRGGRYRRQASGSASWGAGRIHQTLGRSAGGPLARGGIARRTRGPQGTTPDLGRRHCGALARGVLGDDLPPLRECKPQFPAGAPDFGPTSTSSTACRHMRLPWPAP